MRDLAIDRAEVWVVGPETERYAWALEMPAQFMSNTILKLTTAGGLEGVAGAAMCSSHEFDRSIAETLRYLLPEIMGRSPFEREALWYRLRSLNTPLVPQAVSLIDIALWDMAGKLAGLPLHRLLGGARARVPAYASTPLLADAQAYVDYCAARLEEGFTAIKFHCWCEPSRDVPMVETVHSAMAGKGLALMLDVEQRYTRDQALLAAKRLEPLALTWFEAPLLDTDLEGYRELRRHTAIPILPGGNTVLDLAGVERGLAIGAWSAARIDVTIAGGITPARKIMGLAEAHNTTCELQCWGYTLTQAANLHVMLAFTNCRYFEQPAPYPAFEYGALDVIRPDASGDVGVPDAPGLGIGIDWPAVEAATIARLEVRAGR
jgi:L-alanine-DL-glutamate epimerase-like enolase superfamily enzyme